MSKSPSKRIARLEDICMGAGFLLQKLTHLYGDQYGSGLHQQVGQCVRDCRDVAIARTNREKAAKTNEAQP